jgi:hypothetical protein
MLRIQFLIFVFLCTHFVSSASSLAPWRNIIIDAAKDEALAPNLTVRNLAILCIGAFECINREHDLYSSIISIDAEKPHLYDSSSALRGCLLEICNFLHPSQRSRFLRLAHLDSVSSGAIADNPSYLYGKKIAEKILKDRIGDGASTTINHIGSLQPGHWRRTPPHFRPPEQPSWGSVRTFCIKNKEEFTPPPPPALDSQEYFESVMEVKIYGLKDSPLRTEEETMTAYFWKDFSYTSTPPGHWNEIAYFASKQKHLSLLEESRLFALLNLSMADAGIVAWHAKYKYHLWRPENAIRQAYEIPITKKIAAASWKPLLESPPHPEYPSGHACYSGAAAEVLRFFFETDSFNFSAKSDTLKNSTRHYDSFFSCAKEIAQSRLFGGIHFQFSNKNGLITGKRIANYICHNFCKIVLEN